MGSNPVEESDQARDIRKLHLSQNLVVTVAVVFLFSQIKYSLPVYWESCAFPILLQDQ